MRYKLVKTEVKGLEGTCSYCAFHITNPKRASDYCKKPRNEMRSCTGDTKMFELLHFVKDLTLSNNIRVL